MTIDEIQRQLDMLEAKRDALTNLNLEKVNQSDLFIDSLHSFIEYLKKTSDVS